MTPVEFVTFKFKIEHVIHPSNCPHTMCDWSSMDADTKYLEEFSVFGWSTISYPVGVEHSSDQSVEATGTGWRCWVADKITTITPYSHHRRRRRRHLPGINVHMQYTLERNNWGDDGMLLRPILFSTCLWDACHIKFGCQLCHLRRLQQTFPARVNADNGPRRLEVDWKTSPGEAFQRGYDQSREWQWHRRHGPSELHRLAISTRTSGRARKNEIV